MIRQAIPTDKEKVCDLILMASSCVFEDVLQTNDLKKEKDLLMKYYDLPNTKFNYKNIIVYEQDNDIAGCLVFYDSDNEIAMNQTMESILDNNYKYAVEAVPGTIYLDSIAVDTKFQGLGISKKLFEYAINKSNKDLSLLVETYKTNVEDYYKRLGFEVVEKVYSFNCEFDLMILRK